MRNNGAVFWRNEEDVLSIKTFRHVIVFSIEQHIQKILSATACGGAAGASRAANADAPAAEEASGEAAAQ